MAGLSPLAPARLAVDMGTDGLRFNRNFLRNLAQPDFVLLTNDDMTDAEVEDFIIVGKLVIKVPATPTARPSPTSSGTSRPWD